MTVSKLIDKIDSPADLKGLDDDQLTELAQEVRELIIETIGEIGGHFGANLGACEIAVAIHSLLDSPSDKVLWDVGHQAYPHKVLTGRRDELHTIRKYGGLAPFCSTSWAPATRRPASRMRSASRRPCGGASRPTARSSR
jgi:1-deoxy-D-xylulose-5-phosphate synthase